MKNISVIGIGRLGLCLSLVLEKAGYNVVGCDIDENYVKKINNKSFNSHEANVNTFLKESQNFHATTNLATAVKHGDLIFVTVRTDSEPDGKYDHSQVESVVNSIIDLGEQKERKHLVLNCNVNPGYSNIVGNRLKEFNWDVSYNPETIAQGTIINDYLNPDCVYIGTRTGELADQIESVYKTMCNNDPKVHKMDRLSAELTKVSLNCFLTTKISFANMVGDLATQMGANPEKILSAVGSDSRIGTKYFKYGFGYGGPCFPRDNRAFIKCATDNSMPSDLCKSSDNINRKHLDFQVKQFMKNWDIRKPVHIKSVTYKEGTTILEESQQLAYALRLAESGYKVIIKESEEVIQQLEENFGDLFEYE